ncbi:GDP-mannose 4,6-dehydratase [Clostridium aestuarii]|uniref:GDP-mannose 4,6-dehydratase n=1 Tax=Clostridium aestuarii TaxID=338193 RepID=A0ABT4CXV1_9CLOT|nr:GDP-mannose 4,6-dehydratase [Clostridium aestuarii]MCY6482930.1 GDP-mannose 4,6-dehydratase [Clostridium aestuarii]
MKVLITGGCGFIGSHVVERFYKEGHKIYIIDNLSTGNLENIKVKHKFYNFNIADKKCEEIFRANKFDIVIHLSAQVDIKTSLEHPYLDTKSNLLGLTNMLDLSSKYGVNKFIFASSAAVYGNTEKVPVTEETLSNPIAPYGMSKSVGEFYCKKWKEIYGLNTLVFRFSNVYGPRQGVSGEAGVISIFLKKAIRGENLVIFGNGKQTRDFIYVEDLVDGIYKASMCDKCSGVMNLSTNTEVSLNQLVDVLSKITKINKVIYKERKKGDILRSRLDNTKIKSELNWNTKYCFEDGIKNTYNWYLENSEKDKISKPEKNFRFKLVNLYKEHSSYIENIILFLIMLHVNLKLSFFNENILHDPIDYNLIYIGIMGLLYGRKHGIYATVYSLIIYITVFLNSGGDLIVFLYEPKHLIHVSMYLLVGVIAGYSIDKKNLEIYSHKLNISSLTQKYDFLKQIYNETRIVKEELESQIIDSEDSFGKIYNIVKKLDSLEKESVYNSSIGVIEEIMKTTKVSVYSINRSEKYLRLKAKSNVTEFDIPVSMKIKDYIEFSEVIDKQKIFINRKLDENIPMMIAPIVDNDTNKVIGVIIIHEVSFENLTLYYENLFKTLVNLISGALLKAYKYEQSINDKRYVKDTSILKTKEFNEVIEKIREKKDKFRMNSILIRVLDKENNYVKIDKMISKGIREEDYLGVGKDGYIYILLINTNCLDINIIIDRFKKKGILAKIISGECDNTAVEECAFTEKEYKI